MKKLIIILFLIPIVAVAQFKDKKDIPITLPLVVDSSHKKKSDIKYQWTVNTIEKKTGKIVPIQFTLYKDGRWTEKVIK